MLGMHEMFCEARSAAEASAEAAHDGDASISATRYAAREYQQHDGKRVGQSTEIVGSEQRGRRGGDGSGLHAPTGQYH